MNYKMCDIPMAAVPTASVDHATPMSSPPAASPDPPTNSYCPYCDTNMLHGVANCSLCGGPLVPDPDAAQAPVDGGRAELLADFVLAFGNKYSPSRDDVRFQDAINMSEEVYAAERVHNFSAAHRKSLIAGLSCLLKTAPPVDTRPDPKVESCEHFEDISKCFICTPNPSYDPKVEEIRTFMQTTPKGKSMFGPIADKIIYDLLDRLKGER